jgi:hypothetical protein
VSRCSATSTAPSRATSGDEGATPCTFPITSLLVSCSHPCSRPEQWFSVKRNDRNFKIKKPRKSAPRGSAAALALLSAQSGTEVGVAATHYAISPKTAVKRLWISANVHRAGWAGTASRALLRPQRCNQIAEAWRASKSPRPRYPGTDRGSHPGDQTQLRQAPSQMPLAGKGCASASTDRGPFTWAASSCTKNSRLGRHLAGRN